MYVSTTKVDVRYAETDQMGVVYHANYLVWCEIGRTKLIEEMGFKYAQLEKEGIMSPVINVQFSYFFPAKYGDTVEIRTWVDLYSGVKVTYRYEIVNGEGKTCVTGTTEHVCVLKETFRPISIKRKYPELHAAYIKVSKKEDDE